MNIQSPPLKTSPLPDEMLARGKIISCNNRELATLLQEKIVQPSGSGEWRVRETKAYPNIRVADYILLRRNK